MNNINIFVSSTCYDLSQVRADLSDFIKNSGHNPILSEFENFPISPELNTVENCIKIVKENADILILIVGSRYGSILENGKSITNQEFLTARQKGIPIFCFIEKKALTALSFWEKNKTADFTTIVDSTQIFEFINEIRNNAKIWTFPFEMAQDIVSTLKIQLSYLFKSSLKARKTFEEQEDENFHKNLSVKSLRIILEKEAMYEYKFLAQVFVDEIEKKEFLKNDIEYSILTEAKERISEPNEIPSWANYRLRSAMGIINSLNNLINKALPFFIKEQGVSSDLKGLYYVSVKYAELYEQLLNWMIRTRSTHIDAEFEELKNSLSEMTREAAKSIWEFPFINHQTINLACERIAKGEKLDKINLGLKLDFDKQAMDKYYQELENLKKYF